jgi:hypothetical protein
MNRKNNLKGICTILFIVVVTACSSKQDNLFTDSELESKYGHCIKEYQQSEVDSIIANNTYTVIFVWTDWCSASKEMFSQYAQPFLEQKPDSIGFISIFYGNEDTLMSALSTEECANVTYLFSSMGALDKIRVYYLFKSFLNGYKLMNYMPVSLLCDKEGNICNYNTKTKDYSFIGECIRQCGYKIDEIQ